MAYCPECGEGVAEIDSFCPHCGITLQPIAISADSDESQKSENVFDAGETSMPKSTADAGHAAAVPAMAAEPLEDASSISVDDAEPNETIDYVEEIADDSVLIDEEINETEAVSMKSPFDADEPSESVSEETLSEPDIQPPVFLNGADEIPEQPSNEERPAALLNQNVSEAVESADQPTLEDVQIGEIPGASTEIVGDQSDYFADSLASEVEEDGEALVDAAMDNFVPGEIPEKALETLSEPENVESIKVEPPEAISDSALPSFAEPSAKPGLIDTDDTPTDHGELQVEEPVAFQDLAANAPESGLSEVSDDLAVQKPFAISDEAKKEADMPATPLILKPEFDSTDSSASSEIPKVISAQSVEIEDEIPEGSLDETLISSPLPTMPEAQPAATEDSSDVANQSLEDEFEKEPKSYTSPNMGGSDTDGKRSKLKPLDEGTVLNSRYEIVRKIGGGGMGAVYLASDRNLGGVLRAVKEMVQSYIEETQQEKAVNDFKRESMLLTSLEHSAIPTIYDYFFDEKEARFYLVMKYINGGDLSARLRSTPEGRIDEKSVVEWAIQVADVLDYLHKREPPIVYRDLKPANIMIDANSAKIMLIDFGIARWINKEEKGVTAVGTMGYAPPELFSGNVEPRSDIYSLGSTMFHLLTGADPQSNPLLIFDFQKNPRPRQINPQLSDQIEGILMLAVEYNADKRFASTGEMRRALEDHLENLKSNRVTFGVRESPKAVTLSDEKVFCGFCGQSIVASDLFCAFCGAKQPIAQKGVHSESYSSVPVTARLTIIGTNELDSPSYTIDKDENLIGRRDPMSNIFPEVDLSKFDPQTKISRRHARIWRDGNKFLVEDLGSSNGTILMPVVNDAYRLSPSQPQLLTNGDRLKLGDTILHFVIG